MHHFFKAALPLHASVITATAFTLALPVAAQVDAGQVIRESQQQAKPLKDLPDLPPRTTRDEPPPSGPTVRIKRFHIEGATRYDDATLQQVLNPFRDRELDFAGLQRAADAISEHYRRQGWHAVALLPQQDLKGGELQIKVVESRLGRIRHADDKVLPDYVPLTRIDGYMADAVAPQLPLNLDAVARATGIANELPGARVGSVLAAGELPGTTDVVLQIEPRPRVAGTLSLDNQDVRATGSVKALGILVLNSLAGWGELYQFTGTKSEGKTYARAGATVPVGDAGWKIGAAASWLDYKLIGDAAKAAGSGLPTGARGNGRTLEFAATYPLLRGSEAGALFIFNANQRDARNETVAGVSSDKRTNSLSFGLQGDLVDGLLGGGASAVNLELVKGRVDLSRVPLDLDIDARTARVQGDFTKLSFTLTRLQRLTERNALWIVVNGQAASRNLEGGEKFSLGGPQGVRAYPLLEASGDEGATATVAWRWQQGRDLRFETFVDAGWIKRQKAPFPGSGTPNEYGLGGWGLAVDWMPDDAWHLNATLARRIGSNAGALANGRDSDGTRDTWRAWLTVQRAF